MIRLSLLFHVLVLVALLEGRQQRYFDEEFDDDSADSIEDKLKLFNNLRQKRLFECKNKHEQCGFSKCCGTLQCYWPDGYSVTKSGRCVDCVQRNQKCQRDAQCCSGLVCHKESMYYVDGVCGEKRFTGGECHEDDQCRSGSCHTTVGQKLKGYGGSCT